MSPNLMPPGPCRLLHACAASLVIAAATPSMAQKPPANAASAAPAEMTPAERAQRDGDKVFKWILIHADKPRKPATPVAEEKPTVVVRAKAATRGSGKGDDSGADAAAAAAAPVLAARAANAAASRAPAANPAGPATTLATAASIDAKPAPAANVTLPVESTPVVFAPRPEPAPVVDDTLVVLSRVEPRFPPALLESLRTGRVKVGFTVMPDGTVSAPSVVASTSVRLNSASLAALAQWRFSPVSKPQLGVIEFVFDVQ